MPRGTQISASMIPRPRPRYLIPQSSTHHDTDQRALCNHDLADGLAADMIPDDGMRQDLIAELILRQIGSDRDPRPNLAVNLNGDDDFFGFRDLRVERRPGGVRQPTGVTEHLPELFGRVRREGRNHDHERVDGLAEDRNRLLAFD